MQQFLKKIYKRVKSTLINLLPSHLGETTREFRFYKESNGCWYVDLPEWKGAKWNLQMVDGADTLLDDLKSPHRNDVTLHVSLQHFNNANVLVKYQDDPDGDGADYKYGIDSKLWLCGVTSWYYGTMPDKIYYRKVLV